MGDLWCRRRTEIGAGKKSVGPHTKYKELIEHLFGRAGEREGSLLPTLGRPARVGCVLSQFCHDRRRRAKPRLPTDRQTDSC
jgi:hypothetical protein